MANRVSVIMVMLLLVFSVFVKDWLLILLFVIGALENLILLGLMDYADVTQASPKWRAYVQL